MRIYLIQIFISTLTLFALTDAAKSQESPKAGAETNAAPRVTSKTVALADIKNIRLDSWGTIEFALEGVTYRFTSDRPSTVAEAAALLDQMKKAKQLVIQSRPYDNPNEINAPEYKGKRHVMSFTIVF